MRNLEREIGRSDDQDIRIPGDQDMRESGDQGIKKNGEIGGRGETQCQIANFKSQIANLITRNPKLATCKIG